MIVGIPKESVPDEKRVAVVPGVIPALTKAHCDVLVEAGAGQAAGYPDSEYAERGGAVVHRQEVFERSDVLLMVRAAGANREAGSADLDMMRPGQTLIGMLEPLWRPESAKDVAERKLTAFSLDLMPRITRAQNMDALSSMAMVSGYKAVLLAGAMLPKMFPLLMTAAGTISPARVFVLGVGVAGLQAISMAHKLGSVVQAYDIRPQVKEEAQSVGAKFIELPLETTETAEKTGYAKAMDESFYRRQRETMIRVVAESDVVITTAAVPGKKSPILVTREMVQGMAPGSVIVDLAAERGGNCELTKPDETVNVDGVAIIGPTNLPSTVPYHASQLYAKNITNFLLHVIKDGTIRIDGTDEIIKETLVAHDGQVVLPRLAEQLKATVQG